MRLFDRLAAVLVALALLVLGVLVPIEVVRSALLDRSGHLVLPWETPTRFLARHQWSTAPILTISGIVAGVGLLLLLAELRRRRPELLALSSPDPKLTVGMSRRGLQRVLAARAEEVDGITSAAARIRRGRVRVAATTAMRDPGDLRQRLTDQMTAWLDGLGLAGLPPLRVQLTTREH